jgi:uncharacterized membrane protein
MEGLLGLLGLLIFAEVVAVPVLFVLFLVERSRTNQRLEVLTLELARLRSALAGTSVPAPAPAATAPPTPAPAAPTTPAPPTPAAIAQVIKPPPAAAPAAPHESLEERVMRRWAVWLGGAALALGAIFLVKYSIEQGWFGPTARVVAGVILGLALWALSEWVRERDLRIPLLGDRPDAVPPALAGAGSVALFASLYSAYALHGLLEPLPTFALLALVGAATVLLSLLHGAFMAWLGLAGVYIVPALIATPHSSAAGLLGYIGIATAGGTVLLRWRSWNWLGWLALGGSVFWALTAMSEARPAELLWPLGLFLLALPVLFVVVTDAVYENAPFGVRDVTAWTAAGFAGLIMLDLVQRQDSSTASLTFSWILSAMLAALAWRYPRMDRLVWIGALLQAGVIAGWDFPAIAEPGSTRLERLMQMPVSGIGTFLTVAAVIGAAYGIGGFALLFRARSPARWAIASAATPLLVLMAVYGRLEHFAVSLPWAAVALGLGALALGAVERLAPAAKEHLGYRRAFAAYAVAMTAAVSLAITLSMRTSYLTMGLALELPALAWLNMRIPARAFRVIAAIVASLVLVRLLLNPALVTYDFDPRPILNDILYLYGVPAAAFALAAGLFRREREDVAVALLEAGAVALTLALISLEIHHYAQGGTLVGESYGLTEQGLQSTAWLAVAYLLARRSLGIADRVREVAWRLIAGAAAAHVLLISVLAADPLWIPIRVGDSLILDALLPAYALSAGFAVLFAVALHQRKSSAATPTAIAGLALGFLYLTLEVRHWFQGPILTEGEPTTAEWYAYSAAWLVYGAALLGLGIWRDHHKLRLAGLAIGAVVAVKAFIFDMSALSGLYRAASFLGLGASLVGLAYLYQRLIARGPEKS